MLPIAPEGRFFVTLAALVLALSHIFLPPSFAWPSWILMALVLFVFRDLKRSETPKSLQGVLSPIDGVISEITDHDDPYLKRRSVRITIRQNRFGEFNLHAPAEAKIKERWSKHNNSEDNPLPMDRIALWLHTDEQQDIVLAMQNQSFVHFLRTHVQAGERTGQGRRFGFWGFGGMVELYLPEQSRCEVRPGQRVKAGCDRVAVLVAHPS